MRPIACIGECGIMESIHLPGIGTCRMLTEKQYVSARKVKPADRWERRAAFSVGLDAWGWKRLPAEQREWVFWAYKQLISPSNVRTRGT